MRRDVRHLASEPRVPSGTDQIARQGVAGWDPSTAQHLGDDIMPPSKTRDSWLSVVQDSQDVRCRSSRGGAKNRSQAMALNKYVVAVSTNMVFFFVNTVFFLAITPVAIAVMGLEFYGLWIVLNALTLFSGIGALGMDAVVSKFSSEFHREYQDARDYSGEVLTAGGLIILPAAGLVAVILILIRHVIAGALHVSPVLQEQFGRSVFIAAIGLLPLFALRLPLGYLLSQLKNTLARTLDASVNISSWLGAVLISLVQKNLVWIAWWSLFANLLILIVYLYFLYRLGVLRIHINRPLVRRMLSFASFTFVGSTAIAMFQQFDRIVVALVLGPSSAGIYSVGTIVGLRLSLITGQATDVMVPYASLKDSVNDHAKLYQMFRQLSRLVSILIGGLGGLLIVWMPAILAFWISPQYGSQNANSFRILILAYCFLSLSRSGHQTLTGMGRVKFTSTVYLLSSTAMLTGLFVLSGQLGLRGAVLANLIIGLLLAFNLYAYSQLNGRIAWKEVVADLGLGIILPLVVYAIALNTEALLVRILVTVSLCGIAGTAVVREGFVRSLVQKAANSIMVSSEK
jgi:O-antigen/teichoic acid export membrane protein